MPEIFGEDLRCSEQISLSLKSLSRLIGEIEGAGLKLVQCDFYTSYRRQLAITNLSHFNGFELDSLNGVYRIFFTCEGREATAQAGFDQEAGTSYAFHTKDKQQYYILRGIFSDFVAKSAECGEEGELTVPATARSVFPREQAPVGQLPAEPDAATVVSMPSSHLLAPPKKRKSIKLGVGIAALGSVLTIVGLIPSFRSAHSGERQTQTGEQQLALESRAQFTEHRSEPKGIYPLLRVRVTYEFVNVGRGVASSVKVRCGSHEGDGPEADLGTVAAQGGKASVDMELSVDPHDIMHRSDTTCLNAISLIYDDNSGHYSVCFDAAGNASPCS